MRSTQVSYLLWLTGKGFQVGFSLPRESNYWSETMSRDRKGNILHYSEGHLPWIPLFVQVSQDSLLWAQKRFLANVPSKAIVLDIISIESTIGTISIAYVWIYQYLRRVAYWASFKHHRLLTLLHNLDSLEIYLWSNTLFAYWTSGYDCQ